MNELKDVALVPSAIAFLVEVPITIIVENSWLEEHFRITAQDFLANPRKVRELSGRMNETVFAIVARQSIHDAAPSMTITEASAIMKNKTTIQVDIEECGLGESKL